MIVIIVTLKKKMCFEFDNDERCQYVLLVSILRHMLTQKMIKYAKISETFVNVLLQHSTSLKV